MARIYFSFAGLLLILQVATATNLWEFGEDVLESREIFSESGVLHMWDKVKHVTVIVPPCMDLKYVRVTVRNLLTSPVTTFNSETHVVTISYSLLQSSLSSYEVIGKAVRIPYCTCTA